jgi:hypothetical protein
MKAVENIKPIHLPKMEPRPSSPYVTIPTELAYIRPEELEIYEFRQLCWEIVFVL